MIFYRILGNDITLRHGEAQTSSDLAFVLANEPALPGCEKRFMLNRIADGDTQARLAAMIDGAGLRCDVIPFVHAEFARRRTLYEKALYLTNQNAARNRCIELALADDDTVLPFDGQAFFTLEGWAAVAAALASDKSTKYLTVPMFRLLDNQLALAPWTRPLVEDADHIRTEPQLVVRRGHDLRFNERLTYGQANKVELLMRLGVPGPWDGWTGELFDAIRRAVRAQPSRSFGTVREAGFVFRLESGNAQADRDKALRAHARLAGLQAFVERIDAACAR
jgi:hypothetical protein